MVCGVDWEGGGGRWVRVVLISLVNELDGDDK